MESVKQASTILALCVLTNFAHAAPVTISTCIDGVTLSVNSSNEKYDIWSNGFAAFFANARLNKADAILNNFSQEDGSRKEVAEEMSEFDKFERYAETKYSNIGKEALLWGNYFIRNVTYQFRGQNVVLQEAMLCSQNNCEMTTLSENGDADSEVLNLFLTSIGTSNQSSACSSNGEAAGAGVGLFPAYRESDLNPITVQFASKQISPLSDLESINAFAERCIVEPDDEQNELATFNPQCFSGNTNAAIPAIELGDEGSQKSVYFGVDVLMRLLASPGAIQAGVSLKLSNSRTLLLKLRSQIGNEYIVLLPFQTKDKISLEMLVGSQAAILMRSEIISFLFKEES